LRLKGKNSSKCRHISDKKLQKETAGRWKCSCAKSQRDKKHDSLNELKKFGRNSEWMQKRGSIATKKQKSIRGQKYPDRNKSFIK
jgi:hypothetical protein